MSRTRRNRPALTLPQRVERPLFYGGPDPITLNRMESLVTNLRTLQEERFSRSIEADKRRDLDDECGYPKHEWSSQEYYDLIMAEPMAAIVNALYPLESWQVSPSVFEDEDAENATEWEEAWDALPQMLGIEPSYHAGEQGSLIYSFLQTADILSGVGRHGVILIGLKDGRGLTEPATPRKNQELTFLRTFPEHQARVSQFQLDKNLPRYGWPEQYAIQFANPNTLQTGEINEPTSTEYVHWSRVVHLADDWHEASASALFAWPRCRAVRNPLLDIRKIRGSSAEIYYKGGFGGHHIGTHPSLGGDVDVPFDEVKDMYEEYINGLQRAFVTSGMQVDPLAPDTTDPTPYMLTQIEAIAMKMRCPKRKLIGNETGERATEDDKKSWNGVIQSRNHRYVTPKVLCSFINRLINLGVLPKPRDKGYRIYWPDIYALSGMEQADILLKRTQAYSAYVSGGVEQMVPPLDYMTKFDNMEEEEAKAIVEAAEQLAEEQWEEDKATADEQGLVEEVEGFKEPTPDPIEMVKAKASITSGKE